MGSYLRERKKKFEQQKFEYSLYLTTASTSCQISITKKCNN